MPVLKLIILASAARLWFALARWRTHIRNGDPYWSTLVVGWALVLATIHLTPLEQC